MRRDDGIQLGRIGAPPAAFRSDPRHGGDALRLFIYWSFMLGLTAWSSIGIAACVRHAYAALHGARWMTPRPVLLFGLLFLPGTLVVGALL